jgi:signal transduction histidine kinase/ligand-binding sensor domain-containing protein
VRPETTRRRVKTTPCWSWPAHLRYIKLLGPLVALLILPLVIPITLFSDDSNGNNPPAQVAGLHQWGAVTLFHGLPSDRVRAITQGPDGVMWFGTDAGLAKYDGRRTQAVAADGLPAGRVLALTLDSDGVLYVGTESGATRLMNGAFRPINETAGKAINAIFTRDKGRVTLAGDQGSIFDGASRPDGGITLRTFPDEPLLSADSGHPGSLHFTSLAAQGDLMYAGTSSRGLMVFDGREIKEVLSHPRAYFVQALETDAGGNLWVGATAANDNGGLYAARDPQRPSRMASATGTVTAIKKGAHDDVWIGTDGHGAFHYKGASQAERFTFDGTSGGLRSDHIYSIYVDREDVVWFGTDKGVCRYDPHALRVDTLSDDAESNFVRVLFRTGSGLLVAGTNSGLFVSDQSPPAWHAASELAHKIIYSIAEDGQGRLLIGTAGGLYAAKSGRVTGGGFHFTRIDPADSDDLDDKDTPLGDSVRAITQFRGATYVASFGRGVERLDGTLRTRVWPIDHAGEHSREVVSLHADREDRLWIGTANDGVFVFDGGEVKSEPKLAGLSGSPVWAIQESGDGRIWFGTAHGLFVYSSGELTLTAPDYDLRSVANAMGAAPGGVWCATAGGGLLRVVMDDQSGPLISRLDAEQGLPSQRVFSVLAELDATHSEALLVGTSRGVARYEPGRNPPMLSATRIISKRIHQLEELKSSLRLDYPQNSLVLDVSAMSSRTFPEQFQYSFLLSDARGQVTKRKLSHDSQFTMEGLHAGRYHVTARAFTKDLVASEPLAFDFDVAGAPFPRTTAALSVLLALALVALGWGYFQNRRIARTSAELLDSNRQLADARLQLANETEAERRRIARDLHDQTLADLRHLLMLSDEMNTHGDTDRSAASRAGLRSEIESISNEVRRICEDLSPSVLENVGLTAALEWALASAVSHAPPECKFEYEFVCEDGMEESSSLPPNVQMQIYRIAQEAISNVCRHAAAARVRLAVSNSSGSEFVLRLEDDGRDFDPPDRKRKGGRGLANIRARASLIDAEVAWAKRAGGGTLFTLRRANSSIEPSLK